MFAYEMKEAIEEAKTTLRGADEVANHIAQAIIGRLRSLDRSTLRRFKKQLQDFNMTTCEWKNK